MNLDEKHWRFLYLILYIRISSTAIISWITYSSRSTVLEVKSISIKRIMIHMNFVIELWPLESIEFQLKSSLWNLRKHEWGIVGARMGLLELEFPAWKVRLFNEEFLFLTNYILLMWSCVFSYFSPTVLFLTNFPSLMYQPWIKINFENLDSFEIMITSKNQTRNIWR